jgi:hypothetical protein
VVQSQPGQIVHETLSQKKKTHHKNRAGGVAKGVGPEFKPQCHQKMKVEKGHALWSMPLVPNKTLSLGGG